MTQRDQNQDAQLDDLFAAARRDAPEPSDAFMQALFDTIPEPNAVTAVIEEPVSTGMVGRCSTDHCRHICNAKHIRGCLCPDRGDCGRCVWRLDWREWWGHWGHFPEPV